MIPKRGILHALDSTLLVAAAVLAKGAAVMLFDLNKEMATSQNIFNDDLPSFSVRARFDWAMLFSSTNEFINDNSNLDELQLRYEILFGRFSHYEAAFLTEYAIPDAEDKSIIDKLKAGLLSLEEPVYALMAGSSANARIIREDLRSMQLPWQN